VPPSATRPSTVSHRARPASAGPTPGRLRGLGADVDGDLGDADPLKAAAELLERQQFDEIILSTLPAHSRWLAMDLPHRLQRQSGLPVTTIITNG
jgi:GABA permease